MSAQVKDRIARISPDELSSQDLRELESFLERIDVPIPPVLITQNNERVNLPPYVVEILVQVLDCISKGQTIHLVPDDEEYTTQTAADRLGVSRTFLIQLLESGQIPFHLVGSHRRIVHRDLVNYQQKRDTERRAAMDALQARIIAAGLDDADYTGEE